MPGIPFPEGDLKRFVIGTQGIRIVFDGTDEREEAPTLNVGGGRCGLSRYISGGISIYRSNSSATDEPM